MAYNLRTGLIGSGDIDVNVSLNDLNAANITTGVFSAGVIPELSKDKIANAGTWDASDIPDLDASKLTSGTIASDRLNLVANDIPELLDDVSCSTITATGNNQFGDAIGDQQTLNGMVSINGQFVFVNDSFIGTNQTLSSSLNVGSGDLVVDHDDGELTIGCDTILDGEVSMAEGGSEAFNYNAHGLTNVGSIAMKTGGDISNCDEITCETLHVNSGLNLDGVSLNLDPMSFTVRSWSTRTSMVWFSSPKTITCHIFCQ